MFELAALSAAGAVLKSAVAAALDPSSLAGEIAGSRADSLLVRGWTRAAHAIGCLRKNWNRLEPQENHILLRAMLLAHWRAVQQTAQQHARHRGIGLNSRTAALPLPGALAQALDDSRRAASSLGLFSQADEQALRQLVGVCDQRIADIENETPIQLPAAWESILDAAYSDVTALVQQGRRPAQNHPAEQAWTALAAEFPQACASAGFQPFFLEYWFDFFSINFQFLTREPAIAALLTGKLFHEIKEREEARALDPQELLDALDRSVETLRADIAEFRQEQQREFAEVKSLIKESLRQTTLAEPEPLIGLPNTHTRILARDAEAAQLLEALARPGPRIVSIAAPPGFGKSALFAHAFLSAFPNRKPRGAGLAGVAVLDARTADPDFSKVAGLLGRMTGRQDTASRFSDLIAAGPDQDRERQTLFFDFLRACGPLWLVIENAEAATLPDVKPGFRALLQGWCAADHEAKLLVLSRHPLSAAPACHQRLTDVERRLYDGLPLASAVELLRDKLAGTRHGDAPSPLLEEIAERVHRVPLALVQFAGYLLADETLQLDRRFIDTTDLLQLFDPDHMEKSIARIVEEHLNVLDATSRRMLRILAWAGTPVPQSGLLAAAGASGEENAGPALTRLSRSGLVNRDEAPGRGVSFGLHPVVQDIVARVQVEPETLLQWSNAFSSAAGAAREKAEHRPAEILYSLTERGLRIPTEQADRIELDKSIAKVLVNRGVALKSLGRFDDAIAVYEKAIGILRPLVEQKGRPELTTDLCAALMNLGNVLANLGRLDDAVATNEEAIAILRRLVQSEGRRELADNLAQALINRGNPLVDLGRLDDAVAANEEAIAILRPLVRERLSHLAKAFMNRGIALANLGRLGGAVASFEEAMAILRPLVEQEDRSELESDLARVVMNYGNALAEVGQLDGAEAAHEEAIAILRPLAKREGRRELANDLAKALINRGATSANLGRLDDAVAAYQEAIGTLRPLVERERRREVTRDFAWALTNLGNALANLGRLDDAVAATTEAIDIVRRVIEKEGRRELNKDLASALTSRGVALAIQSRLEDAVADYDEAIAISRMLVEKEGRRELSAGLAKALINRDVALANLGRLDDAVSAFEKAIAILRPLVDRAGRRELANDLAGALYNLALAKQRKGDIAAGCKAIEEARRLWEMLVASGWHHLRSNLAKADALKAKLCGA